MFKFKSENNRDEFVWSNLGDVKLGRENLGESMPVEIYRLFQFTLRSVLAKEYGVEKSSDVLRQAGEIAGKEFCKQFLDTKAEFSDFIAQLQKTLKQLKIGIFRVEKADLEKMELFLIVEEDLECSGLPITDESVCEYDEGFIAGILEEYTGKEFFVREIDCWATGARVCRFKVNLKE
jgi:predicted hydrocarbon binding protein